MSVLRSLAFKVVRLNSFPHRLNKDRNRWKEMLLWLQEATPTTKYEAAKCHIMTVAACLLMDIKSELCLLEIIIDFKLNAVRMCVPDVDDTGLTIL